MEAWLSSILTQISAGKLLPASYFATLDCDEALDARDSDFEFDQAWISAYEETKRIWETSIVGDNLTRLADEVTRESFLVVSRATHQHDIASYVSEDFNLIVRSKLVGTVNEFVDRLWAAYEADHFPLPETI